MISTVILVMGLRPVEVFCDAISLNKAVFRVKATTPLLKMGMIYGSFHQG